MSTNKSHGIIYLHNIYNVKLNAYTQITHFLYIPFNKKNITHGFELSAAWNHESWSSICEASSRNEMKKIKIFAGRVSTTYFR